MNGTTHASAIPADRIHPVKVRKENTSASVPLDGLVITARKMSTSAV